MKLIKIMLIALCAFGVERFCHQQTEGFRIRKIASDLPFRAEWATPSASNEIRTLLKQPYHFLGSGGQCYAFLSEDGSTVIKFFKHHHLRPLPFSIQAQKRTATLNHTFSSFKIAYDHLREETGILYLHLNRTRDLKIKMTLIDPIGISHEIDLDTTTFAVQKCAKPALPTLQKLCFEKKVEEAGSHLASLLDMMMVRVRSGIGDCDPNIHNNIGFIDGKAVEIDLGSFFLDETLADPLAQKRVLFFETLKLRRWLKKRTPELLTLFDLQLAERFDILSSFEVQDVNTKET